MDIIMHWMRTIARVGITDSWEQVRTCLKFVDMSNVFQVSLLHNTCTFGSWFSIPKAIG